MNSICEYFLFPLSPILCLTAAAVLLIGLECFPAYKLKLKRVKLGIALAGCAGAFFIAG